jgi:hypothetical protein
MWGDRFGDLATRLRHTNSLDWDTNSRRSNGFMKEGCCRLKEELMELNEITGFESEGFTPVCSNDTSAESP